jgi:hypothetical protein
MKKTLIGKVAVDSGQLLIADPCYLRDWKDGDYPGDNHYARACRLSLDGGETIRIAGLAGNGVVFPSGYGDGEYAVYGFLGGDGRILKVEIDFR